MADFVAVSLDESDSPVEDVSDPDAVILVIELEDADVLVGLADCFVELESLFSVLEVSAAA